MEFTVVLEGDDANGYSAYSPDVPGVYATGNTEQSTRQRLVEGVTAHLRWMKSDGQTLPTPNSRVFTEHVAI